MLHLLHTLPTMNGTELIQSFTDAGGWSILMLGMTIVALVASILMIGFGANIVWYHDKEDDDVTPPCFCSR